MDTETTIGELETLSIDFKNQSDSLLSKVGVINLAVSQLRGTLTTQAGLLEDKYRTQITGLETTVVEKNLVIENKDVEITNLKAERDALQAEKDALAITG